MKKKIEKISSQTGNEKKSGKVCRSCHETECRYLLNLFNIIFFFSDYRLSDVLWNERGTASHPISRYAEM